MWGRGPALYKQNYQKKRIERHSETANVYLGEFFPRKTKQEIKVCVQNFKIISSSN